MQAPPRRSRRTLRSRARRVVETSAAHVDPSIHLVNRPSASGVPQATAVFARQRDVSPQPAESVTTDESAGSSDSVLVAGAPAIELAAGLQSGPAEPPPGEEGATLWTDLGGLYPFRGQFLTLPPTPDPSDDETPPSEHVPRFDRPVRLHYLDEGPRDAPPLLFVHGNPTWSFAWRQLIVALRDRFRCIAVDHIGCGRSEKPADYPYRLARHRQNLQTLIAHLDLQEATLVAHDWGGAIGCAAAGRMPDRFSALVLMNTAAFPSERMPWRIAACRVLGLGPLGVRGLNGFAKAALSMAVEQPLDRDVQRGYLAPYESWGDRVAIQAFVDDIPMKASHPSFEALSDCERRLANLASKRILLPWGEQDWCFTTEFRDEFVKRFPAAIVAGFPNAGHYVFEDAAEPLRVTIETFLRR